MTRMISAIGLAMLAMAFAPRPALASGTAPWCAVINTGFDVYWDCQYRSSDECYPHILAGNRGFCNPNPAYVGPAEPPRKRAARHRRVRHD